MQWCDAVLVEKFTKVISEVKTYLSVWALFEHCQPMKERECECSLLILFWDNFTSSAQFTLMWISSHILQYYEKYVLNMIPYSYIITLVASTQFLFRTYTLEFSSFLLSSAQCNTQCLALAHSEATLYVQQNILSTLENSSHVRTTCLLLRVSPIAYRIWLFGDFFYPKARTIFNCANFYFWWLFKSVIIGRSK